MYYFYLTLKILVILFIILGKIEAHLLYYRPRRRNILYSIGGDSIIFSKDYATQTSRRVRQPPYSVFRKGTQCGFGRGTVILFLVISPLKNMVTESHASPL